MKKNILVTGSNGFVGKHLVKALENSGLNVIGIDLPDHDITNEIQVDQQIDHVFHLAALIFVPDSWKRPADFYRVNMMGTTRVIEFCRKNNSSLTFLSSYVYGTPEYLPIDEKHPVRKNTPYNHSKFLGEEICRFYNEYYQVPVTILRPFNLYGPGQRNDFLIPSIINQIFDPAFSEITVQNLVPKRDFLYIDDFVKVLLKTTELNGYNLFNIGYGKSYSVGEIIDTIKEITSTKKHVNVTQQIRINEVNDVVADITYINKETQWKPVYSLKDGLSMIVNEKLSNNNTSV